jgi:hypothetical protein
MVYKTPFRTSMHMCCTIFLTGKNRTLALPLLTICSSASAGFRFYCYTVSVVEVWIIATRNWNGSRKWATKTLSALSWKVYPHS